MIESYKKTTLRNYPNMGKWSESVTNYCAKATNMDRISYEQ